MDCATSATSASATSAREAVHACARKARRAVRCLRSARASEKNSMLLGIAAELEAQSSFIVEANKHDMEKARASGMTLGLLDRLELTDGRVRAIAQSVRDVAALPDPIGEVVEGRTLPNGLRLTKVRVPMGVIGMIYEARPNVTVDAAVLALKAGSSVILRGGSAAQNSNMAFVSVIKHALVQTGYSADLVNTIDEYGREGAQELMRARKLIDLLIPRGGAGLIQTVVAQAQVPVIETGVGNVHVYVDQAADIEKAVRIVVNSKLHRTGVCNAAESLLVHRALAPDLLPRIFSEFASEDVLVHADEESAHYAPADLRVVPACEEDWATEYLAKEIAVKIVPDIDAAIEHIGTYSTGHTEAIVSEDYSAITTFINAMDCAAVIVNASTRFTDGGEFGMGAEIGISTQKLHARGPMGVRDITTTSWIVEGDGHVRG